jgi:hypothetical protein
MYIDSGAGLGESEQELVTTRSGDKVGQWLPEKLPSSIARVIGLWVIFRPSFADFRLEVAGAVARWVASPRFARQLVAATEDALKALHQQMLTAGVPDKAPVRLLGSFFYQATGCSWRVVKLMFPPGRERWERITLPSF